MVAKGFTQKPGIDYNETFAPVARIGSIRLLMGLATELNLKIHQLDLVSGNLNGEIEEEIYMEIPNEFYEILDKNVCGKQGLLH